MNAYATLLGNAGVRRLIAGASIARLPTAMLPLAILLLVVETDGSLAAAGLVAGAFGLGRAVVSPAVGALIDRAGQPRVLIGGSVVQAIALLVLVGAAAGRLDVWIVGAVATVAGAASPPVQAAQRALWPRVAGPAQLDAAYSFDATSQELIWIAGPLLVAALLGAGTAATAVVAAGVIGCAGVAIFATSTASREAPRSPNPRILASAVRSPGLPALIGTSTFAGFAWGALSFGLSALAVELGRRQLSGFLLAALSAGSIGGGLVYGSRRWSADLVARLRVLQVACALLAAPLIFAGSVAVAVPAALLAGLPLAPLYAASYALTGRIASRDSATEAFTWMASSYALGISLGTAVGGAVTQSAGVRAAFALACVAPVAAWFLTPLVGRGSAAADGAQAG